VDGSRLGGGEEDSPMVGGWLAKAAWEVAKVFVGYKVDVGDRGLEVVGFEPTRSPVVVAGDVGLESERHDLFRRRLGRCPSRF